MRRRLFVTMGSNLMDVLDAIIDEGGEDSQARSILDQIGRDVLTEVIAARVKQRDGQRDS